MRLYGLTGGAGSGKTEAGRRFAQRGIPVLDADAIGHELIEPGGPAFREVVDAFGDDIVCGGRIDRTRLAARAFADPKARARLDAILHPAIRAEIGRRCAALADEGHALAIIDAALIAEHGQRDPFLDGLIVVACPKTLRVRRLVRHRGFTEADARRRIAAQTPPETKLAFADWVIENTDTLEALWRQVDEIVEALRAHE